MPALTRQQMAARAARELTDGSYVNLGIGLPTLIPNYLAEGTSVLATHHPMGSHVDDTVDSPASTTKEVVVMVMMSNRMTLPSSWDLPLSFSGVKTTRRTSANTQPTKAMV